MASNIYPETSFMTVSPAVQVGSGERLPLGGAERDNVVCCPVWSARIIPDVSCLLCDTV